MNSALLALHWRRHRVTLAALAAGLFAFEWLFTRLQPGPEQAELMRGLFQMLPPYVAALLGEEVLATLTPRGLLGFGYAHPFILLMLGAWVVRVGAGALAGEIGQGTMDLLAARPVARGTIVRAAAVTLLLGLTALLFAAWSGTALGLVSRPAADAVALDYAAVAASAWLLFAGFGGVTLAISAAQRAGGSAIGVACAFIAVSFALDYLAKAWAPIGWMRPASLFAHHRPIAVLARGLDANGVLVLGGVALAGIIVAHVIFARRDL